MASYDERKKFIASVVGDDLLENAIDWIKSNMEPEEVFDKSQLEDWAENNDYIKADGEA